MSMLFVEINRFELWDLCVWHGSTLPRIRIDFEYARWSGYLHAKFLHKPEFL